MLRIPTNINTNPAEEEGEDGGEEEKVNTTLSQKAAIYLMTELWLRIREIYLQTASAGLWSGSYQPAEVTELTKSSLLLWSPPTEM